MIEIIVNNPYRILGVYSNSPIKNRIANINRINAFYKIGKTVTFETDLNDFIRALPNRNENTLTEAQASINLPINAVVYALTWFCDITEQDKIALHHIGTNDIQTAKNIWSDSENLSSLWNTGVLALCLDDFALAYSSFNKIIEDDKLYKELLSTLNITTELDKEEVTTLLYSTLTNYIDIRNIISVIHDGLLKDKLITLSINPILTEIQTLLDNHDNKDLNIYDSLDSTERLFNQINELLDNINVRVGEKPGSTQLIIDKVGKAVNKDINQIFEKLSDDISSIEEDQAKEIIERSNNILEGVRNLGLSPLTDDKIKENIKSLTNFYNDIPRFISLTIATNDNICWCCGGPTEFKRPFAYTREETSGNIKTTYTRTIDINLCGECNKEIDTQGKYSTWGIVLAIIVEYVIIISFMEDHNPLIALLILGIGNLFGFFITIGLGWLLKYPLIALFRRNKREFIREIKQHPAVVQAHMEGFS